MGEAGCEKPTEFANDYATLWRDTETFGARHGLYLGHATASAGANVKRMKTNAFAYIHRAAKQASGRQ